MRQSTSAKGAEGQTRDKTEPAPLPPLSPIAQTSLHTPQPAPTSVPPRRRSGRRSSTSAAQHRFTKSARLLAHKRSTTSLRIRRGRRGRARALRPEQTVESLLLATPPTLARGRVSGPSPSGRSSDRRSACRRWSSGSGRSWDEQRTHRKNNGTGGNWDKGKTKGRREKESTVRHHISLRLGSSVGKKRAPVLEKQGSRSLWTHGRRTPTYASASS